MQVSCPWFWKVSKVLLGGSRALTGSEWFLHHGLSLSALMGSVRAALLMSHTVDCFLL